MPCPHPHPGVIICLRVAADDQAGIQLLLDYWHVDLEGKYAFKMSELMEKYSMAAQAMHSRASNAGYASINNVRHHCGHPYLLDKRSGKGVPKRVTYGYYGTNRCRICEVIEEERRLAERKAAIEKANTAIKEANAAILPSTLTRPNIDDVAPAVATMVLAIVDSGWNNSEKLRFRSTPFTPHPKFDRQALEALWSLGLIKPVVDAFEQLDERNKIADLTRVSWFCPWTSDYEKDLVVRQLFQRRTAPASLGDSDTGWLLRSCLIWELSAFAESCAGKVRIQLTTGPSLLDSISRMIDYASPPVGARLIDMAVTYSLKNGAEKGARSWEVATWIPKKIRDLTKWYHEKHPNLDGINMTSQSRKVSALTERAFEGFFGRSFNSSSMLSVDWETLRNIKIDPPTSEPSAWRKILFATGQFESQEVETSRE